MYSVSWLVFTAMLCAEILDSSSHIQGLSIGQERAEADTDLPSCQVSKDTGNMTVLCDRTGYTALFAGSKHIFLPLRDGKAVDQPVSSSI